MTFDYGRIRAVATRQIRDKGFPATIEKPGKPSGDPWNPTPGVSTRHPIHVVQEFHRFRDAEGALIGQTVHTLLVAAEGTTPEKADKVALGGETRWHEVAEVRPVAPGGVAVMYELDLQD